jgi:putative ABC transport system permease protein
MALHTLFQDVKYALRQLRNAPTFAITAILTLALGIGANTAIFSLLDQALLRSLPVRDPHRLVILEGTGKAWEGHASSWGGDPEAYFSYPMYKDLRDQNQAFEGLIATSQTEVALIRSGASQMVNAEIVSGNYFTVLGVRPTLGRVFTQSEDKQEDGDPVAVISYEFWKGHLAADPRVVGETVSISGHPFQIIGVSAPQFRSAIWGERPALFVPMSMIGQVAAGRPKRLNDHKDKWLNIIGRLKTGESRAQAQIVMQPLWHALRAEELQALGTRSKRFTDDFLTNSRMLIKPGARGFSYDRENYEKPLFAVMAMALLVLLIAAVNVASLLLVRSASRVREFSLRYALGADAKRIVQQLLLEGLLIGIAGGAAGMLLARVAMHALLRRLTGEDGSADFTATIDGRLLLFNFGVALIVSVLFSLAPTMQLRRPNLSSVLGQRGATGTGGSLSFRRVVVCLQIGLSVVLLVGAGLFVRTMQKLRAVDVGFNTTHLVGFGVNPKLAGYAPEAVAGVYQQISDRLSALPGVQSVAATDDPELAGNDHGGNVTVQGYTPAPEEDTDVEKSAVSENYFAALQIPLLTGRYFNAGDAEGHALVAIVNESFVKHFCKGLQGCLGRQMADGGGDNAKLNIQIVGIVHDSKHSGIRDDASPTLFLPIKQQKDVRSLFFYLRTVGDPSQDLSMVRGTMQQFDSRLAIYKLGTMDAQIDDDLSNDSLVMSLAVSFGVLAVLLAGVGIYGVLAYSTTQRTREIGIRIALGSSRMGVARIILGDVLLLAGISIAVALPATYGLSHLLQSQLFGVSPADPFALISAVLLVALVALIAALIPAQRAAAVDPMQALRTE